MSPGSPALTGAFEGTVYSEEWSSYHGTLLNSQRSILLQVDAHLIIYMILTDTCLTDGYIAAVLPISLLLQRLPLVKTLAFFVLVWGIICILTVAVTDYPGLVTQRVFLGVAEASSDHRNAFCLTDG